MASSPPMSKSPSRSAAALQPSKSDTNLAASAFAAYPQYAAHPQGAAPPSAGPSATERPSSPNSLALAAAAAAAASSAQHPHHAPLIPSYPYNLSMSSPFIPGCSSSDPRLFEQHAPDDSSVQTRLPSIAVDYLSHDWKEDDVWASWKAMTKHKSELANGVRLENASWRTWAKQRGKLKTISPETLNWLKDSDVTWLYGPLHTAVDPVPPPRQATTAERLGLSGTTARKADKASARSYSTSSTAVSGHHGVPLNVKPILKHRSLSDILSVPNSGAASPIGESGYPGSEDEGNGDLPSTSSSNSTSSAEGISHRDVSPTGGPRRPGILRTNSADASYHRKANVHPHGFDAEVPESGKSPETQSYPPAPHDLPSSARGSFRRTSSQEHFQPKKRHIVFNHRVEQCISLDAEDERVHGSSASRGGKQPYSNALQRYGSHQGSSSSSSSASSSDDDDDDDDEDNLLTFRSSSPKSPSFMKPFLPSPTTQGPPNLTSGPGNGKKIPYGAHGPHGQHDDEPHTIAPLEPTTLKDSELMPGPTPIVVFQDGKITAFYGTEENYVYDPEQHGGVPHWAAKSAADLGGTAIMDEEEDDTAGELSINAGKGDQEDTDAMHYEAVPANSSKNAAIPADIQSSMQNAPVSSSLRYPGAEESLLAGGDGQIHEPQMEASARTGYFAGPETAVQDDYDSRLLTSSQAKYGSSSVPHAAYQMPSSQPVSTSSSNSSSEVTLSGTSPGNAMLYSTSPSSGLKGPGKSILKKGRDPSQPGSADYYPPVPPAVTRASRAHAQMFDENGDEVVSPQRAPIRLPETGTLAQDGSTSPSLVLDSSSNQALSSPQPSSLGVYSTSATSPVGGSQQEPTRGRSISRGNSSSSLYERAQSAAAAAEYRSRSQSGGSSISPVASYSPPFTASLNSLGAGTAVMQSQPAESSRARGLQAARPSTRREALSDTSSEEGDSGSSDTEGDDDEGQAANMDFSEEGGPADMHSNTDSVHFARHHNLPQNQSSIKQSHRDTLNDDDDAELEQVSSPETSRGATLGQQDFESRPANAAHAGRGNASLISTGINPGKQANAALPSNGSQRQTPSLQGSGREELTGKRQKPFVTKSGSSEEPRRKSSSVTSADQEDQDEDSDAGAHLFDSPYMPSSPTITSSTNLASLPSQAGSGKETSSDPYTLSWADKEDSSRSRAEGSLLQSLASTAQSRPSWLMRRRSSSKTKSGSGVVNRSAQSEDELSDPANNGYSYGYGFDDEEDDQRGYVGRATDLIGALWNVGSGMVWGRPSEGSPSSSKDPSVQKASK